MIAYGGNGAVHAWAIADELGVDRVLVPRAAPVFSALGLLVADYVVDVQRSHVQPLSRVDPVHLQKLLRRAGRGGPGRTGPGRAGPGRRVGAGVRADGLRRAELRHERPAPGPAAGRRTAAGPGRSASTTPHEADRGFAFRNQQPVVRGVRALVAGRTPKPPTSGATGTGTVDAARRGTREAYFGDGFVDTDVLDGEALGRGCGGARPGPDPGTLHRGGGPARLGRHAGRPRRLRADPELSTRWGAGCPTTSTARSRPPWTPSCPATP